MGTTLRAAVATALKKTNLSALDRAHLERWASDEYVDEAGRAAAESSLLSCPSSSWLAGCEIPMCTQRRQKPGTGVRGFQISRLQNHQRNRRVPPVE
jgi:hypothetical protein